MISFAWPGIIGGLAFYALNLLDRFFVKHYHGLADTGLYGAAVRYSQVVVVGVLAFRMGWTQWHYPLASHGRHPQMVARGANYYFFATGFLAVARLGLDPSALSPAHAGALLGRDRAVAASLAARRGQAATPSSPSA